MPRFYAEDVDKLRSKVLEVLQTSGLPDDACLMAVESAYLTYAELATAMHANDDKALTADQEAKVSAALDFAHANAAKVGDCND